MFFSGVFFSFLFLFFFSSRRRHTRLVSDWSSDVCSSDLGSTAVRRHPVPEGVEVAGERRLVEAPRRERRAVVLIAVEPLPAGDDLQASVEEIEAARSCRFRRRSEERRVGKEGRGGVGWDG